MSLRAGVAEGSRTIPPVVPAAATAALAAGVAAPAVGLTPLQSVTMSIVVYFPSVMLVALDLIESGVPEAVIITSLVVIEKLYPWAEPPTGPAPSE